MKRLFLLFSLLFCLYITSAIAQQVIYVDRDALGANDGSSWENAYTDLSVAIDAAESGSELWVAAGVYYPTSQPNYPVGSPDPQFNHFTLKNGVTILGGFAGDETSVEQRDLTAYKTVLSGDIDQNDNVGENGYVTSYNDIVGDNSWKLFYFPDNMELDTTAVLDGFVLAGAKANNSIYPYNGGAAMLCLGASPKIVNCEFYGNYAMDQGGAVWVKNSSIVIENCTFSGNYAGTHGGGFFYTESEIRLKGCTFVNNTGKYGGAMSGYTNSSVSVIEDCLFEGNVALDNAGVFTTGETPNVLKNCTFKNNSAPYGGALVLVNHSSSEIINCTFEGNQASAGDGGAIFAQTSHVNIYNNSFRGNEAYNNGGAIINISGSDLTAYNTLFSGNVNGKRITIDGITNSGSAIYSRLSKVTLINSTVVSNYSYDNTNGAGVNNWDAEMIIQNSIIWNNRGAQQIRLSGSAAVEVMNSIVQDGYTGSGNLDAYPMFLSSINPSTTPSTAGSFYLLGNSPANNKGVNTVLPKDIWDLDNDGNTNEVISLDLNGNPRVFAGVVDIGCYEQQLASKSGNAIGMWVGTHMDLGTSGVALNGTDFTIELWYYMQAGMTGADENNIFGRQTNTTNNGTSSPALYVFQNDRLKFGYGNGSSWKEKNTEKVLKLNQWNHIALTFNDATNTMKIYANGRFLQELTGHGEVCSTPVLRINNNEKLRGVIDEFRIWKEERTFQQVLDNMNRTLSGNEENLTLYYNFDQVTSGNIEDLAGNNNGIISLDGNGNQECGLWESHAIVTPVLKDITNVGIDGFTISWNTVPDASEYYIDLATDEDFENLVVSDQPTGGATTYTVNGLSKGTVYFYKVKTNFGGLGFQYGHTATKLTPPGNAFAFDGSTYIDATDVCKYDLTSGATIECWVKLDFNSWENDNAIWACNTSSGGNNYVLIYSKSNSKFRVYYNGGDSYFEGSAVNENEWNHIALTIDPGNTSHIYLNGEQTASYTPAEDPFPYESKLSLGQEYDGTNWAVDTSNVMKGAMDEFRVWSGIRTPEEIQANLYTTLVGDEVGLVTYYNFDQQTGSKVVDNANVFDGTVIGNLNWIKSTIDNVNFKVIASAITSSGFTLNWDAVSGATSYTIDVATDAQFTDVVIHQATDQLTYNAVGLTQGTKYYFRVTTSEDEVSMVNYTNTLMEIPGNALWFDGIDDYVEANQISETGNKNTATMECWVYVEPTETMARFLAINTSTGGNKYLLSYEPSTGYCLYLENGATKATIASHDFRKDAWVHLAVVMNGSTLTSFYLNGKLVGTATGGSAPIFSGNQISFGQEFDGTKTGDFLKGAIDEVRFWSDIRTQAEIQENMHKKLVGNEADLLAYYDFDQNEGQFVFDKKNSLDGTIIGNPQWIISNAIITPLVTSLEDITPSSVVVNWFDIDNASDYKIEVATDINFSNIVQTIASTGDVNTYQITGLDEGIDYYLRMASYTNRWSDWSLTETFSTLLVPPGNALAFDGVDGEVNVGYVMQSNWNHVTLEAWVKLSPNQINGFPRIIGNYGGFTGFSLNLWNGTNQPYFEMWNANGIQNITNAWDTIMGPRSIADNIWHHIACTYDGTDMKLFLDGQLISVKNNPGAVIKKATQKTGIGNQNGAAPLNGTLDEIRIWNIARTQAELQEFAHKTLTGSETGLVSYFNLDKADGNTFKDEAGNYDGTMTGGVSWAESKALITPFTLPATNVGNNGFTANWESIQNASTYYLRVATDPLLTQLVEGWENVEVGNVTSFDVTGLTEHTSYYFGVMSQTDRLSAWSPSSEKIITTGGSSGTLAANLTGNNNYLDLSAHISRIAGKNAGAITGWFKGTQKGDVFRMNGASGNIMQLWVGDCTASMDDESLWFVVSRSSSLKLSMGVREGEDAYLDGQWHHFAIITGDGNNRMIIDGIEKEVYFYNGIGNKQTQEFSNILSPSSIHIGKDNSILVDELAIYKNPLTNEEVIQRAHQTLTGSEMGLVLYYSFNEVNSTIIVDDSGMGRDAAVAGSISFERANVLHTPFLNYPVTGVTVADLNWTDISNASQYAVDVAADAHFQSKIADNLMVEQPTINLQNLDKNTKYFYRVKAKVNEEWSEWSATGEFFTLPGKAIYLDGVDDYMICDGILANGSIEATVECWVKVEGDVGNAAIWAINSATGNTNHYILMYSRGAKELSLWENDPNLQTPKFKVDLTDGWHHIAVSLRNGAESQIYIDGKIRSAFTPSINPLLAGFRFSIGQEYDDTDAPSDFYKGQIDEFRVWNIALTEEQIRANMNLSEPEGASEHYIAHYTFDELHTATTIKDLAKQNDATLVGSPTLVNSNGVINPIILEPSNITSGGFTLNINDIVSAQSYELVVAYDPTFVPPLALNENIGKNSSHVADGLCPGVKYFYKVRAIYDSNTISDWSAIDSVETVANDATITNFVASQGDYSEKLKLSWQCSYNYLITDFEIKRRIVGDDEFEYLATVANSDDLYQFVDETAQPGTYYEYSIQGLSYCYNNDTNIEVSNVGFNIPTLSLSKEINGTTQQAYIRLDWNYHPNFCNNVEIKRTNTESGIVQFFQEVSDSLVYRDGEVSLCTPYSYQLIAKTADYGNINSLPKSFTLEEDIFDAIDTLDASKGYFDSKITLNWVSHKQNIIDEYQISRRRYAVGSSWQVVKIIDKGTTQTWIDEDAIPGEYYEYLIVGIGSCGDNSLFTDSVYSIGFRQPEGTISGQINYQGGNPVRDVKITALYDDASRVLGRCVQFNGTGSISIEPRNSFTFDNGQTVEMWIRPNTLNSDFILFQNAGLMAEYINTGELSVLSGSALVGYNLKTDAQDVWIDDSWNHIAIVSKANELGILINGTRVATASATPQIVFSEQNVVASGLAGYVDELRIWNIAKTDSLINRHHKLVLGRSEQNLICALRFDEGLGTWAFDHTRTNDEANKSHAIIVNGTWSENVPSPAKLALAALTEPTGNYQINGVWFKGSGDTYRITPSLGVHQFDPSNRSMMISENSLVYSNQNFTDISSFVVTGNVKYFGADFPVTDVMLAVDGQICVNPEGAPIVTDQYGNFTIEVPIGNHFISVAKMGHIFSEGYFPVKSANGEVNYFNFNDNISGIQFIDSTFLTVAGRIVGGTVEGDKVIGFGKSVNNLGVSSFVLKAVKGYPIEGDNFEVAVSTNAETGEYEVKLFPEQFEFVGQIGNAMYQFNSIEDKAIIDLSGTMMETTETDTLENGDVQTYMYHLKRNWIYRSVPTIEVLSEAGTPHFYDLTYIASDENENDVEVALIDEEGNHTLGYPVFTKGKQYKAIINVFEQYENADNGAIDQVPVTDGTITTINTCAAYPAPVEHEIVNGIVEYEFLGGFPNPTIDDLNPELSYTKTFEVHATTGNQGSIHSQWPQGGPFRAYVFGGIPTGNNFLTQGPDLVDFILRDPAGSNSHAFFESGFTISNSTSNSFSNSAAASLGVEIDLGWELTTFVGFGAGIISTNEQVANVNTGVAFESNWESGQSFTTTTTFNKSYSTSDDPAYVGEQGDLFFGHSTNISYGVSNYVKLVPVGGGEADSEIEGVNVNGFTIGRKKGINFGLKYNTDFVYSLNHIENYLIPDLEGMAEYFTANGNTDSASYYQQQADIWKGVLAENEYQKYYAMNHADPQDKNISFDAGAIYEESITTEVTETRTSSFDFSINSTVSTELGFEIMGVGTTWSFETSVGSSQSSSSENSETTTTTVGFALNDGDQGDYFSVDVLKCHFGNGPVFVTKGGQSACPYEDGNKVEYADYLDRNVSSGFVNGYDLNFPTMRIEVPRISAENAIISGVPENKPAEFMLKLSNQSEVGADSWFTLLLDGASNPYGARLLMDGASIANGVSILVPGGKTLTKTLQFYKGRSDINDYENINVILHSQCQFDPTDDLEDIGDTVRLTANFVPTCTDVAITYPGDGWLVNIAAEDQLPLTIGEYNLQHGSFEKIALQYKPESSSSWNTAYMFFNDTTNYASYTSAKEKINGRTSISHVWDMSSLQDRVYQVRAVSMCVDGSVSESEPLTGTLDGKRPEVFGTPSPADGILSPEDEIMISFSEPIEEGLVTYYNISVEGVVNGAEINHGTSVAFDGDNDYAVTPEGINLSNLSYAIEFWMQKEPDAAGTVISTGRDEQGTFSVNFTTDSIFVNVDEVSYKAKNAKNDGDWHHWAVVYNNTNGMMYIYTDDQLSLEVEATPSTAVGAIYFGKQCFGNPNHFTGNIHDVRVWRKALGFNEVIERMNIALTGNEVGLIGYWPMDEAKGNLLAEKARSRHATMFAEWNITPGGYAYSFNGTERVLTFAAGSIPINSEMDMTIELWFKAEGQSSANGYLFSNGNTSIETYPQSKVLNIYMNPQGQIVVENNGKVIATEQSFNDNDWHHLAFVVNRRAYATLYVDGEGYGGITAPEIGSLEGAFGYIGARGYVDNSMVQHYDGYFNGSIDEVRVWNTARKQEQVKLYMNNRLSGTEAGLKAYFPFEKYEETMGVMLSVSTFDDQSVDPYSETEANHCGTLAVSGEESFTNATPAIRRARAKSNVNFEFVTNNDKIIITPTDPLAVIERCILEITVKNIEDKNANRMASPVSWTAFIEKNQVRWGQDEFAFEKEVEKELTFETSINNIGGVERVFSISNIPSWLTVVPSNGTLAPNSSVNVTFTVSNALNIGNYAEELFLESGSGYSEKLMLNLKAYKKAPNWEVDETAFASSMNIIGKLRIKGVYSNDSDDVIGVFAGNECRGVAKLQYKANYDDYFTFLVVYGNTAEESLTYKVWDASEGKVYADVTPSYAFEPNALYGSMASPIVFEVSGLMDNSLALNSGWNWLSFNLEMENPSITNVFGSMALTNGNIIKHADLFSIYDEVSGLWFGSLENVEIGKLYRVYTNQGGTLTFLGSKASVTDYPIELVYGWNRIGYVPNVNLSVNEALAGFEPQVNDVVKSQYQFAMWDGYEWIGSLSTMRPGSGYMYKSGAFDSFTFVYPENSSDKNGYVVENETMPLPKAVSVAQSHEYSMSVVAQVDGGEIPNKAQVAAYVNGSLRGIATIVSTNSLQNYCFITINGDKSEFGTDVVFTLLDEKNEKNLIGMVTFESNAVEGTLSSPVPLKLQVNNEYFTHLLEGNAINAFPNPFAKHVDVVFMHNSETNPEVRVMNALGMHIASLTPEEIFDGLFKATWNGESTNGTVAPQGIYYVVVSNETESNVIQIVKSN